MSWLVPTGECTPDMLSLKQQEHVCCFSLGVYGLFRTFALPLFGIRSRISGEGTLSPPPGTAAKPCPFLRFSSCRGSAFALPSCLRWGSPQTPSPDPYTVTSQNSGSLPMSSTEIALPCPSKVGPPTPAIHLDFLRSTCSLLSTVPSFLPYRKAAHGVTGRPCSQLSPSWGRRRGP